MTAALATAAVFALLLAPFFLLMLALVLRSRRNAAGPEQPASEPALRAPPAGPWYVQIASYFPPYYTHAVLLGVAALFVLDVALHTIATALPPSWLYVLLFAPASFAVGHAWAFILDFLRSRMGAPRLGDLAQPVAYYTPDMAPTSYQPTFRTLSSLLRLMPFLIGVLGIALVFGIVNDPMPAWRWILRLSDFVGLVGFWIGCREIQRGAMARRS